MVMFQRTPTHWIATDPFFSFQPYVMSFYVPDKANNETSTTEAKKQVTEKETFKKSHAPTLLYKNKSAQRFENKHEYSILLDIPGVKIDDIQVEFSKGNLLITAVRKTGLQVTAKLVQKLVLDEYLIDVANITASLIDGVLTVIAPKKAASAPTEIPIITEYPPEQESTTSTAASNEFRVTLDLPGVRSTDLKVLVDHRYLAIVGERHRGEAGTVKINKWYEFDTYTVDSAQFNAYLKDGVLTLTAVHSKDDAKVHIAVVHDVKSATTTANSSTADNRGKQEENEIHVDPPVHGEDKLDPVPTE